MRNLKIPRTEIFLLDRGIGKQFATSLYNRSTQPAMLRLCEVGEINSLNTRLPKQDALNRQHFGCEKSSTKTSRREPKISRAAKPHGVCRWDTLHRAGRLLHDIRGWNQH